ncbi:T9SS type A sorting domain-containing protein [candidate division KSB1 bacterium]|nr:T9SS type A sorting domain-containing protein [candidate division KSB1 bacterium]
MISKSSCLFLSLLLFCSIFLLFFSHQPLAQSGSLPYDNHQWKHFISMFGHAILTDQYRENTVWVASEGGLIRYTGIDHLNFWDSYTSEEGLSHSSCYCLAADAHAIWLGRRYGAARFDILSRQFTPFLLNEAERNSSYILTISPQVSKIWIGTDNGLVLVDKSSLKVTHKYSTENGLCGNSICSILDDHNYLWLISRQTGVSSESSPSVNGLTRIHKYSHDIQCFGAPDSLNFGTFNSARIINNRIWIGSSNGLYTFHKYRHVYQSIADSVIANCHSLCADSDFVYCITTAGRLYRIENQQNTITDSLTIPYDWWSAEITCDSKNLYIVRRNRFFKIPKNDFILQEISTPFLPSTYSRGISSDGENTYVGSADYLAVLNGQNRYFSSKYKMPGEVRQTIIDDRMLWISTNRELRCYQRNKMLFRRSFQPTNPTIYLTGIDQDYAWIATHDGVYRYDKRNADAILIDFSRFLFGQAKPKINCFLSDNQYLWFAFTITDSIGGLHTGIIKMDRHTTEILNLIKFPINDYTHEISGLINEDEYLLTSGKYIYQISKETLGIETFIDQKSDKMFRHMGDPYLIWVVTPQGIKVYNILTKENILSLESFRDIYKDETTDIFINGNYAWICTQSGISALKLSTVQSIHDDTEDHTSHLTFSLHRNFPNPFNRSTTIEFDLYSSNLVTLEIFNLMGNRVKRLLSQQLRANKYFVRWAPDNISSGVYFYRLKSGNVSETKKLLYVK